MANDMSFYIAKFDDASRYLREGIAYCENDEDLTDLLGAAMDTERAFKQMRSTAAAELEAGTTGQRFKFRQGRESVKTYNTSGLLIEFVRAMDLPPLETLMHLIRVGVVSLEWHFSRLEREMYAKGISITMAAKDIEDGDPDHLVGKRWKDKSPTYDPI